MADVRLYQPSFTSGELSPALTARSDLAKYHTGLQNARNVFIHPHGGVSNRAGLEFVREVKFSDSPTRIGAFQFSASQSYIIEYGHAYLRFYRDGGIILSSSVPYEITTPYFAEDLRDLVWTQEADVSYHTHVAYEPQKLARYADTNWTLTTVTFAPGISAPSGVSVSATGNTFGSPGYVAKSYSYKVSAVGATLAEESLASSAVTVTNDLALVGGHNTVTWTSSGSGVSRYLVYKLDNGIYGYIGGTEGTSFKDENITADTSDTPQKATNPFSGTGNFPRCSTFHEQRLVFGSTENNPQGVWMSQSANYENFNVSSPAKDSDAITFRARSREVNEIRSFVSIRQLLMLTSAAEFVVAGTGDEALTPTNPRIQPQSYYGASKLQPIVTGNTILFAQERGGVVRDFSYDFSQDGYSGKDLTIMSRHLFEDKEIVAWAYAQAPFSLVFAVMSDGTLNVLTYIREHEVWGWARWETDGLFLDVAVIAENGQHTPYFIIQREIDGETKQYIERLALRNFSNVADAFFVDSGLSYSGTPVTTLSGLGHLEGKTVSALVDGNVVRGLVVNSGSVTLPISGSKIHIGLPYEASIQTLDVDLGQTERGTVQGRKKTISEVTIKVERTRGIWTGPSSDISKLVEYKQRSNEPYGEPTRLLTGNLTITPQWDWTSGGAMWVKQFDPLPMTILAIMPDLTVGG